MKVLVYLELLVILVVVQVVVYLELLVIHQLL